MKTIPGDPLKYIHFSAADAMVPWSRTRMASFPQQDTVIHELAAHYIVPKIIKRLILYHEDSGVQAKFRLASYWTKPIPALASWISYYVFDTTQYVQQFLKS